MTHSLAKKVFAIVLVVFLLVLLVQAFFLSSFFETIYVNNIIESQQRELHAAVEQFTHARGETRKSAIADYTAKTGSSILVVTESHDFADTQFLERLGVVPVALSEQPDISVITTAYDDYANVIRVTQGAKISVNAVQLGTSRYYEPLVLAFNSKMYTNLDGVHNYKNLYRLGGEYIETYGTGRIAPMQSYIVGQTGSSGADRFLYARVSEGLVRRLPMEEVFREQVAHITAVDGMDYAVYVEERTVDGERCFFASARQVIVTGQERTYFNRLFYSIYLALGALLAVAAWFLSRYLSRPLIHLSEVTRKLAQLDFTQTAQVKSRDEVGLLAESINDMAGSLETALEELKDAGETARSNEARMQRLLRDLAHEFKTPLFVISSYSEALELGIAGDDTKKYYSYISDEVDKLSGLVNEVIELSNIQMGTWKVVIGDWDIRDVIQTTVEKFEPRFRSAGFTVRWSADEQTVRMDARRIEQVLENFLSNALKYADEERRIEIFTELQEERLLVCVGNSGTLSEEDRERIWDRYYKGDAKQLVRLPSEGIGLDIVKTTLEAHGSDYGVEQREGMVWFHFTLELGSETDIENE